MEELEERLDRDQLDAYLVATEDARDILAAQANEAQVTAPVDNLCTPLVGLLSTGKSGSSSLTDNPAKRNFSQKSLNEEGCSPLPVRHPRTHRGYALARKLVERAPRWQAVSLPSLAAALQPLAERGWTAFQVDRATETYGPVTSASGLSRVLHAVVAYVSGEDVRRHAQVSRMTARIVDAALAGQRGPAVWSDTSDSARAAYDIAVDARTRRQEQKTTPAGWDRLVELTDPPAAAAADRSSRILAVARRRAATERARRTTGH